MGIWMRTLFLAAVSTIGLWFLSAFVMSTWSNWQGPIVWNNGVWFCLHLLISMISCWIITRFVAPPGWIGAMLTTLTYLIWLTILRQLYGSENQAMAWLGLVFTMLVATMITAAFVSKMNHKKERRQKNTTHFSH